MKPLKIITILSSVLLMLISGSAWSHNESGPIGGIQLSVGSASSSGDEPTLNRSSAYGGGAFLGYMLNNAFSFEAAYTSVGGPQWGVVSVTDSSMTINAMIFIHTSHVDYNAIYLQIGTGMLTTTANLTGQPSSRSNTGGILGIGYEFNHAQMNALRIGFTLYDTGYNQVRTFSVGPVWKF